MNNTHIKTARLFKTMIKLLIDKKKSYTYKLFIKTNYVIDFFFHS